MIAGDLHVGDQSGSRMEEAGGSILGYLSLTKTLSKIFSFQRCSVLLRVSGAEMIVVSHVFSIIA